MTGSGAGSGRTDPDERFQLRVAAAIPGGADLLKQTDRRQLGIRREPRFNDRLVGLELRRDGAVRSGAGSRQDRDRDRPRGSTGESCRGWRPTGAPAHSYSCLAPGSASVAFASPVRTSRLRSCRRRMVNWITGRERRSQPAARPCCRLSDFRPPQLSNLQPPLTTLEGRSRMRRELRVRFSSVRAERRDSSPILNAICTCGRGPPVRGRWRRWSVSSRHASGCGSIEKGARSHGRGSANFWAIPWPCSESQSSASRPNRSADWKRGCDFSSARAADGSSRARWLTSSRSSADRRRPEHLRSPRYVASPPLPLHPVAAVEATTNTSEGVDATRSGQDSCSGVRRQRAWPMVECGREPHARGCADSRVAGWGPLSLVDKHRPLRGASWTAGCRTGCPVVWEVGTG